MNDVKFVLNRSGVKEILKSDMMMGAVEKTAMSEGEIDASFVGFDRVQVIVKQGGSNADRTDHT